MNPPQRGAATPGAMRILLTGSSGYLGSHLVPLLLNDPDVSEVIGIDLAPSQVRTHPKWVPVREDIRSPHIRSLFKDVDCLIHLAFIVRNIHDDSRAQAINLGGAQNVLEAARSFPVRRILFTSSAAVYGCLPENPLYITEDRPLRPDPGHVYSACKVRIEESLNRFQEEKREAAVTVLRPVLVMGPGADNSLVNLFRRNLLLSVRGHDPLVQAVHVQDMARALHLAVQKAVPGTFNVAAPDALSVSEICRLFRIRQVKLPKPVFLLLLRVLYEGRISRIPPESATRFLYSMTVDATRFQNAFQWKPAYTTQRCLAELRRASL